MGGPSKGRPQNARSTEWRRTGSTQRSMEGDSGSGNGPKWPGLSIKKKKNTIIIDGVINCDSIMVIDLPK